jgi:glycerophosphoryl diester phosphodiesterase
MEPLIIAHRGFSAEAPENTMAAFRLGWQAEADGVECDVHLTADGEVICIHDFDTERVSGIRKTVSKSAWSELEGLDAGAWKDPRWAGEGIPLLGALIRANPAEATLVVEIKCGPEIVASLLNVFDRTEAPLGRLIVISFVEESLIELKRQRPEVKAYWLSYLSVDDSSESTPSVQEIVDKVERLGVDGFGGQSGPGMSRELIEALEAKGFESNVWTVDDPAEARRMRDIGLTSITTNNPTLIREALERSEKRGCR